MWKTFRLNDGTIEMATKVWSDFGATIPLERSFTYGINFPPQYPIFAGPPIRYHFIFFALVGNLERIGIPLDWALNTLSALGFLTLLIIIYLLSKNIFQSKFVGTLSAILFLFNGSWGFLEFFKKHPISVNTISDIITNETFSSFGPYDRNIVSAFWSLNIFTNQRHLALGYAASLFLLYIIYRWNREQRSISQTKAILLGLAVGLFPFIHLTAYIMMCITLSIVFLLFPKLRLQIFTVGVIAGILGIPQFLYMGLSQADGVKFFHPGYLVEDFTILGILKYWFLNLGLTSILAPIGFCLAKRDQRKFLMTFIAFFIIGSLFQFSPEMASNHKFFNMFVIGANMFTAYTLYKLWYLFGRVTRDGGPHSRELPPRGWMWGWRAAGPVSTKVATILLLLPLTFTGIIDIFPVFNDRYMTIRDIPKDQTAQFILQNTAPNAVFLNATFLYDPASLAGRNIYLGWPYFAWSAGYNTDFRFKRLKSILASTDKKTACNMLRDEKIDYLEIQEPTSIEEAQPNYVFFKTNFDKIYFNSEKAMSIYDVRKSCV